MELTKLNDICTSYKSNIVTPIYLLDTDPSFDGNLNYSKLYNITTSLYTSLSYHQLVLHLRSVLANIWDSLSYIRTVSMHTMDYMDAATTGTLSPHILHIADHKQMLSHIEETLPPTMQLPVSSEDNLHFYRYLCTHVLIANRQFLLLKDIPIQVCTEQFSVYKIFTLDIPHENFTAQYDVNTQYLEVTRDKTIAVDILQHQLSICLKANEQFYNIITPLQPLANLPSCITALYSTNPASISARCSLQVRKVQSISIPSSIAPNVWILTLAYFTVTTAITSSAQEKQQNLSQYKNPSMSCDYHQLAALHHHTFIYHHDMNIQH